MDKRGLIADVARDIDYKKWEVEEIINRTIDVISDKLKSGEEVSIKGFGRFKLKYHKPRKGSHPKTGKPIDIDEKVTIVFSPSQQLEPSEEAIKQLSDREK